MRESEGVWTPGWSRLTSNFLSWAKVQNLSSKSFVENPFSRKDLKRKEIFDQNFLSPRRFRVFDEKSVTSLQSFGTDQNWPQEGATGGSTFFNSRPNYLCKIAQAITKFFGWTIFAQ